MAKMRLASRRQFLRTGVGAATAALCGTGVSPVFLRAQQGRPAKTIRCGMIGVGGRGSGVLAAIHKSPGVRVTALCDIDNGRLQAAAKTVEENKPRLFGDYRKMLDHRELDAVFVETPCYLHKEMIVAVLASGRHCYAEKPMALTVPDLDAVVRATAHNRMVFQIGTQLRYASPWKPAIAAIHSGVIGKPILIRAHRHYAGDVPHDHTWVFFRKQSGDPICEQAVHEFDIFNAVFQATPVRASGFGGQALLFEPRGRDIMDHYTLSLDYGMSRLVAYSHSWISSPEVPRTAGRKSCMARPAPSTSKAA